LSHGGAAPRILLPKSGKVALYIAVATRSLELRTQTLTSSSSTNSGSYKLRGLIEYSKIAVPIFALIDDEEVFPPIMAISPIIDEAGHIHLAVFRTMMD
jgi:hypothetical protein